MLQPSYPPSICGRSDQSNMGWWLLAAVIVYVEAQGHIQFTDIGAQCKKNSDCQSGCCLELHVPKNFTAEHQYLRYNLTATRHTLDKMDPPIYNTICADLTRLDHPCKEESEIKDPWGRDVYFRQCPCVVGAECVTDNYYLSNPKSAVNCRRIPVSKYQRYITTGLENDN